MSLQEPGYKEGLIVAVVLFLFITYIVSDPMYDPGVFVVLFWMGLGLIATHLLYRTVVVLEEIRDALWSRITTISEPNGRSWTNTGDLENARGNSNRLLLEEVARSATTNTAVLLQKEWVPPRGRTVRGWSQDPVVS
ncbi:hypothetical protein ACFQMM_23290 [Saliphagus sp. GCM10025308]